MNDTILRIAVSTRALFCLEEENRIFLERGAEDYVTYQMEHEDEILPEGPAFELVRAFLKLNEQTGRKTVEIMMMSKNSAEVVDSVMRAPLARTFSPTITQRAPR